MDVQLRHAPSFTVARCVLAPGETVRVEGGAMIAHSAGVQLESKAQGGLMAGLRRSMLGGGSFFVTTYTAPPHGGWVDVAGVLPGDTVSIDVSPQQPFFLRRGSWIANSAGVEIDTQWGGMANLFGGEGGFGYRASGQGQALVSIYGAVDIIDLDDGEAVTIDTGHVVAYALDLRFQMRRAVHGRSIQSMKSGEGWVFDFFGPGRVLLQSRNPDAFASWVGELNPSEQPREGLGGLGGLGNVFR
ncbi:MAG TPA: TIGR00266 family protein [Jatrophihabitans sp.]|nr:TIGR00266 family protein [Jatrophihabitans sp.]